MRVLVSGSSGLLGTRVRESFCARGHSVVPLVRSSSGVGEGVRWDPANSTIDSEALEGFDWVIHLAGESIAQRWTAETKRRIRESRVVGTRLLCEALSQRNRRPTKLVCASAIGIYGNRGDELLTEQSAAGADFLAQVAQEWEQATKPAADAGIGVVNARCGVVLSQRGGALAKLLPIFRAGTGGPVGGGRQYMSWISLEDAVRAVDFCLQSPEITGPVNVVSPQPVTNREFAQALGHALGRPAIVPAPAFAIRLAFGEMGEATVLASQRVMPARLQAAGFQWLHGLLPQALKAALQEPPPDK